MSKLYFYNALSTFNKLSSLLGAMQRFSTDPSHEIFDIEQIGNERITFLYKGAMPGLLDKNVIQSSNFSVKGKLDPKDPFGDIEGAIQKASDLGQIGYVLDPGRAKTVAGNFFVSIYFQEKGVRQSAHKSASITTSRNEGPWQMQVVGGPGSKFGGDPAIAVDLIRKIQAETGFFIDKSTEEHLKNIRWNGVTAVLPDAMSSQELIRIQKTLIGLLSEKTFLAHWTVSNVSSRSARENAIDTYNQILIRNVPAKEYELNMVYNLTNWQGMECLRQLVPFDTPMWVQVARWRDQSNDKNNAGVLVVTITPEGYRLGIGAEWPLTNDILRESFTPETLASFSDLKIDFTSVHLGTPYAKSNLTEP